MPSRRTDAAAERMSRRTVNRAQRRRLSPGSLLKLGGAEVVALGVLVLAFAAPKITGDPFLLSFVPTVIVAILGTLHVWLLLRVHLLSFASPPFMAVGGYTAALLATKATPNAVVLVIACILVPAGVALLLGALLLRLRGTYFALVTFVLAQIAVLFILINPRLLGGNSGISGIPPAELGGLDFAAEGDLVRFSAAVAILGLLGAAAVTITWRRHFAAINENEQLAASLGLRPWGYKTLAFAVAASLAGLAGLVLVNQLGNAHPDSFAPFMAVNHVAAAVVGGAASILGVIVGALALSWLTHVFASQAEYAQMLLGLVLVVVVVFARDGLTGLVGSGANATRRLRPSPTGSAEPPGHIGQGQDGSAGTPAAGTPVSARTSVSAGIERRPAHGPTVLEVAAVSKSFGGVTAVAGISAALAAGEVLGVIGPNGAGKTTLVNMLAGEMSPSAGEIRLDGSRASGLPSYRLARKGVARTYQQTSVFGSVSVRENLARARQFSSRWMAAEDLDALLRQMGLADRLDDTAGDLPYGLQKVLGLVVALATEPRLLLLDEPAAGLEVSERRRVDEIVRLALERGCAVVLVEHDMDLVRRICERVLVMDAGQKLAEGTPEEALGDPQVVAAYLGETEPVDTEEAAAR